LRQHFLFVCEERENEIEKKKQVVREERQTETDKDIQREKRVETRV